MNSRCNVWKVIIVAGVVLLVGTDTARAYIDPGTQAAVAGSVVGILAMFAGFFGIVLWPFRWLLNLICKRTGLPRIYGKIIVIVLTLGGATYGVYALDQYYDFLPAMTADSDDEMAVPTVSYANFERVMILGMDGLDANIVEEMMQANQLPNFAKLKAMGCYARLQTSNPPQSPVAWSCIATGCNPGKHGIFDFIKRVPSNYEPQLSIYRTNTKAVSREQRYLPTRKVQGFWVPLSKAGVPISVVRWPNAFPPPAVNGRFFSGLGVPDILDRMGRYSFYTTNKSLFPENTPNKMVEVKWQGDKIATELFGPKLGKLTDRKSVV